MMICCSFKNISACSMKSVVDRTTTITVHLYNMIVNRSHLMRLWHLSPSVNSISNMHAQQSTGATRLIFGQTFRLLPYFMYANSKGSGQIRLAWAFAVRLCDKYYNLMSWLNYTFCFGNGTQCLDHKCLCILSWLISEHWSMQFLWQYICAKYFSCLQYVSMIWATSWENLFMAYANNKGANQPVQTCASAQSDWHICCSLPR